MKNYIGLGNNIRNARLRKGFSMLGLARESGISFTALRQVEIGQTQSPRPALIQKIAKALKIPEIDLIESITEDKLREAELEFYEYKRRRAAGEIEDDVLSINEYDLICASAGDGSSCPEHENELGVLKITKDSIRGVSKLDYKHLSFINVSGDSMEPLFHDRDQVLINTNSKKIKDGKVYVISMNEELFIKRIYKELDGSIKAISENKRYPPFIIQKDSFESKNLSIIGLVEASIVKIY